jgi:hypothetical protein
MRLPVVTPNVRSPSYIYALDFTLKGLDFSISEDLISQLRTHQYYYNLGFITIEDIKVKNPQKNSENNN